MEAAKRRADALRDFAQKALATSALDIAAASADASFRSYWRLTGANGATHVVMDAPPGKEALGPWLDIGARLRRAGLHAPEVLAVDRTQGFVLMEDLGNRDYLGALDDASADALYGHALDALLRMQAEVDPTGLPLFDETFITQELELMPEWFLRRHLGYTIECDEWDVLELAFRRLIQAAREQPQTFMHRDYHSRNLLVPPAATGPVVPLWNPGLIDFQGAVAGPVAYDLASLLRDCYITWDAERVERWMESFRERLRHAQLPGGASDAARFRRWFDLAGLQRHLKVLGIFCRLCYRDGKAQYLGDLPVVWRYVMAATQRHPEFADLAALLERVLDGRDITQPRDAAGAVA